MVDSMRVYIARQNLHRYERILDNTIDPKVRSVVEDLLKEARAELDAATAEDQFSSLADRSRVTEISHRWRSKAEEFRATADITQNKVARDTYLRLAENYERLATDAESRATREPTLKSKPQAG